MRDRKLTKGTPVVEAILEFRIKEFPGLNTEQLRQFADAFADSYPIHDELRMYTGEFAVTPTGIHSSAHKSEPNALVLKSDAERDLLRVRLGSLVAIRLEPYDDWSQLTEPVLSGLYWLINNVGISKLERIGARFVNRFQAPHGKFDIEDWFKFTPDWPDDLEITNFLSKYTAEHANAPFVSTVTQTIRGGSSGPELILDIDTFAVYGDGLQLEPKSSLESQLGSILTELRGIKNEMFFKHVTENALERYK